jgi:sugar lactone lactonase YvrE
MKAEQVTGPVTWHGEGPFWDRVGRRMLVVDMLAGAVVDLASLERPERYDVGSPVAAVIRRRSAGGFVVATEHGFSLFDEHFSLERRLPDVLDDPGIRLNEGGCDPHGRFYCGAMAYDESPGAASLYRLDPDGSVSVALTDVTISNGLQWNQAGDTVFYADTPTGRVDRFDFDPVSAAFSGRRTFAEITGDGQPDGMAIDEEDGIWVALWGGGAVHRYDRNGRLDLVVELPVSKVTACTFGGPELRTLFITTSRQGLEPAEQPEAGAVFRYDTGLRGAPQHAFAG